MAPATHDAHDERHAAACAAARRVLAEFEPSDGDGLGELRRRYRRLEDRAGR